MTSFGRWIIDQNKQTNKEEKNIESVGECLGDYRVLFPCGEEDYRAVWVSRESLTQTIDTRWCWGWFMRFWPSRFAVNPTPRGERLRNESISSQHQLADKQNVTKRVGEQTRKTSPLICIIEQQCVDLRQLPLIELEPCTSAKRAVFDSSFAILNERLDSMKRRLTSDAATFIA